MEVGTATRRIQRQHIPSIPSRRQNRYNLTTCSAANGRTDKQDIICRQALPENFPSCHKTGFCVQAYRQSHMMTSVCPANTADSEKHRIEDRVTRFFGAGDDFLTHLLKSRRSRQSVPAWRGSSDAGRLPD